MIGQLINKFDNLPENESTLETFNNLFKTEITGNNSDYVEIGGITTGGFRNVSINGKTQSVRINDRLDRKEVVAEGKRKAHRKRAVNKVPRKKVKTTPRNIYIVKKDGVVVFTSNKAKDVCKFTGLGATSLHYRVVGKFSKFYKEWEVSREPFIREVING